MGCTTDKPTKYNYELVMISGKWKGILAGGPAPTVSHQLMPTKSQQLKRIAQKLKNFYFFDLVICLLENKQIQQLGIQNQFKQCEAYGIQTMRYEIPQKGIPADKQAYLQLVKNVIKNYLNKQKRVLVHCKYGKGRTGTFIATCLLYKGYKPCDAIKQVRKWVPHSIDSQMQEKFILNLDIS